MGTENALQKSAMKEFSKSVHLYGQCYNEKSSVCLLLRHMQLQSSSLVNFKKSDCLYALERGTTPLAKIYYHPLVLSSPE